MIPKMNFTAFDRNGFSRLDPFVMYDLYFSFAVIRTTVHVEITLKILQCVVYSLCSNT
jgi:hypothetical protein